MKKIIISAIVVLVTMSSFAQTHSSEHLTFKGVPIDGTLNEFVSKMKKKGFILLGLEDGFAILEGDFASHKNCTIAVATLKQKDLVSKITVKFPESNSWSDLSTGYFTLKNLLTEKYGKPSKHIEEFESGLQPSNSVVTLLAVGYGDCNYYTIYETPKGTIQLSIEHDGVISSFIVLSYYDRINGKIIKEEALKDL